MYDIFKEWTERARKARRKEVGDDVRDTVGARTQSFVGPSKEFEFYSKCDEKPLEGIQQVNDMI